MLGGRKTSWDGAAKKKIKKLLTLNNISKILLTFSITIILPSIGMMKNSFRSRLLTQSFMYLNGHRKLKCLQVSITSKAITIKTSIQPCPLCIVAQNQLIAFNCLQRYLANSIEAKFFDNSFPQSSNSKIHENFGENFHSISCAKSLLWSQRGELRFDSYDEVTCDSEVVS